MSLSRISSIAVQFSPWVAEARGARDFLARISSIRARKSNPDCKITNTIRLSGKPTIKVQFTNKKAETIDASDLSAPQIIERLQSLSNEMDSAETLQKVGVANVRLEVPAKVVTGTYRMV